MTAPYSRCLVAAAIACALFAAAPRARAQSVTNLTFTPSNTANQTLVGGAPTTGTVTLSAAPSSNLVVALANTNAAAVSVPVRVTVTAGHTSSSFVAVSSTVAAQATATITASVNSTSKSGTVTVKPGFAQVLTTVRDSYIEGGTSANTNFGATTPLIVRQGAPGSSAFNDAIILNFDLTNVAAPPDTAVLRLYGVAPTGPSSSDFSFSVYVLPFVSWTENTITWNNCPDFNPSTFASTGTFVGTFTAPLVDGTVGVDVRSIVQGYTGRVITFFIMPSTNQGAHEFAFNSREASSGHPYLVLTYNKGLADSPVPGWAEDTQAMDTAGGNGGGAQGMGPSMANAVNLATGVFDHHPPPDMTVYNPIGPSVSYARRYRSSLAVAGLSAPGLPAGWTDNWDYQVTGPVGTWGAVQLRYPNRAVETLTPVLSSGNPTGAFTTPPGAPYSVMGVPVAGAFRWASITITYRNLDSVTFKPTAANLNAYLIALLSDPEGDGVTIVRNSDNTIADFADGPVNLMTMAYSGGLLSTVSNVVVPATTRQVTYTYSSISGYASPELTSVAQMYAPSHGTRWSYGYNVYFGAPLLIATAAPNPSGTGLLTASATYDGSQRVAFQTDCNGNRRAYLYSGTTCRVEVRNPAQITLGGTTVTERWYQLTNGTRNTGTQDAAGVSTVGAWSSTSPYDIASWTNRNGQASTVTYDNSGHGNPATVNMPCNGGTLTVTNTWSYALFPAGLLASTQTGARTSTVLTYYDGTTSVNGVQQAKGLVASVSVPAPGTSGTSARVTYSYAYTALGSLMLATVPAPAPSGTVTYTLAYTGTMADGSVRTTEAKNEPVTITDPLGNVTRFAYDAYDNVTAVTGPDGDTTLLTYAAPFDATHQVTRVDFPKTNDGAASPAAYETFTYLFAGGPVESASLFTNTTDTTAFRRVTRSADGEDALKQVATNAVAVTHTYDSLYRELTLGDGNAHAITAAYDASGNLLTEMFPLASGGHDARTFHYDADYNPIGVTDGNGNLTTYGLDNGAAGDNRLTGVVYPQSPSGGASVPHDLSYIYDALGRVSIATNYSSNGTTFTGTGLIQYSYDDGDRLLSSATSYVNAGGTALLSPLTVSYAYNADGSRDTMTTPAGVYAYTYDAAGRLTSESLPWGDTLNFSWSPGGRLLQQATGLGASAFTYSPAGNMTSITNTSAFMDAKGSSALSAFTSLLHDASGNLTSSTETVSPVHVSSGSFAAGTAGVVAYTYDVMERLTQENAANRTEPGGSGTNLLPATYSFPFTFDAADNLTALRNGSAATSIVVNADDQAVSGTEFGASFTNTFDGEGNPTHYFRAGATGVAVWDLENRVTSTTAYTALYRADGLRGVKPSASTLYLYDGSVVIGTCDATGALTGAFAYGPDGLAERNVPGSGNYYWYTFDPSGNVVERSSLANATGGAGKIADWITRYDAFGAQIGCIDPATGNEASAAAQDSVGFEGQFGAVTDQETYPTPANTGVRFPLVHMAYREYDPALGRFLNRDPLGGSGGIDPYTFAGNNPVSTADASGLTETATPQRTGLLASVADTAHPFGVVPAQAARQRALAGLLPDVLAGAGDVQLPAVQFTLPAVQRTLPAVQRLLPAVRFLLPAVQCMLPAVQALLPAVQLPAVQGVLSVVQPALPAVQRTLPAVQFQVPAVQHGVYMGLRRTRIPFVARPPGPISMPLQLPHALAPTFTGSTAP